MEKVKPVSSQDLYSKISIDFETRILLSNKTSNWFSLYSYYVFVFCWKVI